MKDSKKRRLFLLGSTGSIGRNALATVDDLAKRKTGWDYRVVGLAAGRNGKELMAQVRKYAPAVVYCQDPAVCEMGRRSFPKTRFFTGDAGLLEAMGAVEYDWCLNSLVGSAGLAPTMTALRHGATLALANKESLIMAGARVLREARKRKLPLIPVDSEHSGLLHLLKGRDPSEIDNLVLTASGGPFFRNPVADPTPEQTLAHPTWKMGPKISVDSATMLNKGLEVIEAHFFFDVPYDRILTVVHPQSIVHAMVETVDGEIYAQLGRNDMRHPIQNALTWPLLAPSPFKRFRLTDVAQLSFFEMDLKRFPMLALAYDCGRKGGSALPAMNAANEAAVNLYLEKRIRFRHIHDLTRKAVSKHRFQPDPDVPDVLALDVEIKAKVREWAAKL